MIDEFMIEKLAVSLSSINNCLYGHRLVLAYAQRPKTENSKKLTQHNIPGALAPVRFYEECCPPRTIRPQPSAAQGTSSDTLHWQWWWCNILQPHSSYRSLYRGTRRPAIARYSVDCARRHLGIERFTMPRFFDDYSNTYLTHDSAAGRKQQRRGWKFRENFKLHYDKHVDGWRKGPMGLASAQQAYVRAKGREDPSIPPLPDGWREDVDEATGITFFYNDEIGSRTWVRPGFIPPPPGPPPSQQRPNSNFRGGGVGYRGGPPNRPPPFYGGPPQGYGGNPPPQQQPPPFPPQQQFQQPPQQYRQGPGYPPPS